jgi:protein transport protein SEC61 subunit alpha
MGILLTVTGAVTRVLGLCSVSKLDTGNAVLILLQIIISGIIVIYLDDFLKKGYGLLSGISCSQPPLFGKGLKLEAL